jgi:hypothetical protein
MWLCGGGLNTSQTSENYTPLGVGFRYQKGCNGWMACDPLAGKILDALNPFCVGGFKGLFLRPS